MRMNIYVYMYCMIDLLMILGLYYSTEQKDTRQIDWIVLLMFVQRQRFTLWYQPKI